MVGGAVALLMPSVLAPAADARSAVVIAAVVIALAAALGVNSRVTISLANAAGATPRTTEETPAFLAERVADPVHHPLRPRAPGLV